MRYFLLALASIAVLFACTSKRLTATWDPTRDPDPRWAHIDSLASLGQFASALSATDTMLEEAHAKGDMQLEFRALMNHAHFKQLTGTEEPEIIAELEDRAKSAEFPLTQLLHSVIGEQYWSY